MFRRGVVLRLVCGALAGAVSRRARGPIVTLDRAATSRLTAHSGGQVRTGSAPDTGCAGLLGRQDCWHTHTDPTGEIMRRSRTTNILYAIAGSGVALAFFGHGVLGAKGLDKFVALVTANYDTMLGGTMSTGTATSLVNVIGWLDIVLAVVFAGLVIAALYGKAIAYSPLAIWLFAWAALWGFLTPSRGSPQRSTAQTSGTSSSAGRTTCCRSRWPTASTRSTRPSRPTRCPHRPSSPRTARARRRRASSPGPTDPDTAQADTTRSNGVPG